jgi:hypothetical protein
MASSARIRTVTRQKPVLRVKAVDTSASKGKGKARVKTKPPSGNSIPDGPFTLHIRIYRPGDHDRNVMDTDTFDAIDAYEDLSESESARVVDAARREVRRLALSRRSKFKVDLCN